ITSDIAGITGPNVSRWQRIWYLDITHTGAPTIVDIRFDMSDGGMGGADLGFLSNYVLVYRPGQTGAWTEVATADAIAGDQIVFSNQSMTLDGYYTLATKDYSVSPLPVELLFFDAALTDKRQVELNWKTATEISSS